MMKKFLLLLLTAVSVSLSALDYASKSSWLVAENNKQGTAFDVFYVHPTLLKDAKNPYPDFANPKVLNRLKRFSAAQAGIFGDSARVFVPAVRQLEITRCLAENKKIKNCTLENTLLFKGVEDTVKAFRYYLKHWNPGGRRPYILMGHSQGSMDLYELLKRVPEITPSRGFVAAYLAGLPCITAQQIEKDLGSRGIFPARDEGGTGVVIVWHTQSAGKVDNIFTVKGGYGINPVNWRTDNLKSDIRQHKGMMIFDHKKSERPQFLLDKGQKAGCTAALNDRGAVVIENVPEEAFKLYSSGGKNKVLHAGDVWFFAGNIIDNACLRVRLHQQKKELDRAKMLIRTGKAECVLLKGGKIVCVEKGRGVSPLLRLYDRNADAMRGSIIVDKVIGRAAAAIAINGGAEFVHGELMSEDAQRYLLDYKIASSHTLLVERILNRKRDGLCPLEQSVSGISNPRQALTALRKRIAELMKNAGK